jgi:hypothetical protein
MEEIRSIMRADITSYKIFTVRLNRPDGFDDGSVGIILTSAITGRDNFITVSDYYTYVHETQKLMCLFLSLEVYMHLIY